MALTAVSTSAIALATTAPAPPPAAPSSQKPEAFAKLVVDAKAGDKGGGEAPGAGSDAETGAETTVAAEDPALASPESDSADVPLDLSENLLAEMEAMVAAASQMVVTQTPAAPPAIPTTTATVTTDDIVATSPAAAPVGDQPESTAAGRPAPAIPVPVAAAPIATTTAPRTAAATTEPASRSPDLSIPPAVATVTDAPTAETSADATPAKAVPSDIASLLASLKAAFAPADPTKAAAPSPATIAPAAPTPSVVAPTPQPLAESIAPKAAAALATGEIANSPPPSPDRPKAAVVAEAIAPTSDAPELVAAGSMLTEQPRSGLTKPARPARVIDAGATAPPPPETIAASTVAVAATDSAMGVNDRLQDPPVAAPAEDGLASASPLPAATTPPAAALPTGLAEAIGETAPSTPVTIGQPDQVMARHLDLARDSQWLDQLARDISAAANHQGQLKFQLNPEHLGALTVEIANSAAGTAIRMTADTDQARAIIADAQPRLIAEVRAQGLRVAESHVDLNQQGSGGSSLAQGQQRQASEDHKPFAPTQSVIRDDAIDSAAGDDGELYA